MFRHGNIAKNCKSTYLRRKCKTGKFADFEHKQHRNLPVGILIGIDFYHVFMTGKVVRSNWALFHVKLELGGY